MIAEKLFQSLKDAAMYVATAMQNPNTLVELQPSDVEKIVRSHMRSAGVDELSCSIVAALFMLVDAQTVLRLNKIARDAKRKGVGG